MGNSQSADGHPHGPPGSGATAAAPDPLRKGYHVLKVRDHSPAHAAGLLSYFHFIVAVNGQSLDDNPSLFPSIIKASVDQPVLLTVYSARSGDYSELAITPRWWTDNQADGLIGCSIRYCDFQGALLHVWHVVEVLPNSPAQQAGLVVDSDYIVGTPEIVLREQQDLYALIAARGNEGKPLRLFVYSTALRAVRDVTLCPRKDWGGQGLIGAELGYGALHRIPVDSEDSQYEDTDDDDDPRRLHHHPTVPVPGSATVSAAPPSVQPQQQVQQTQQQLHTDHQSNGDASSFTVMGQVPSFSAGTAPTQSKYARTLATNLPLGPQEIKPATEFAAMPAPPTDALLAQKRASVDHGHPPLPAPHSHAHATAVVHETHVHGPQCDHAGHVHVAPSPPFVPMTTSAAAVSPVNLPAHVHGPQCDHDHKHAPKAPSPPFVPVPTTAAMSPTHQPTHVHGPHGNHTDEAHEHVALGSSKTSSPPFVSMPTTTAAMSPPLPTAAAAAAHVPSHPPPPMEQLHVLSPPAPSAPPMMPSSSVPPFAAEAATSPLARRLSSVADLHDGDVVPLVAADPHPMPSQHVARSPSPLADPNVSPSRHTMPTSPGQSALPRDPSPVRAAQPASPPKSPAQSIPSLPLPAPNMPMAGPTFVSNLAQAQPDLSAFDAPTNGPLDLTSFGPPRGDAVAPAPWMPAPVPIPGYHPSPAAPPRSLSPAGPSPPPPFAPAVAAPVHSAPPAWQPQLQREDNVAAARSPSPGRERAVSPPAAAAMASPLPNTASPPRAPVPAATPPPEPLPGTAASPPAMAPTTAPSWMPAVPGLIDEAFAPTLAPFAPASPLGPPAPAAPRSPSPAPAAVSPPPAVTANPRSPSPAGPQAHRSPSPFTAMFGSDPTPHTPPSVTSLSQPGQGVDFLSFIPQSPPQQAQAPRSPSPAPATTSFVAQPPIMAASVSPVPFNDTSATFSPSMFVPAAATTRSVSPPQAAPPAVAASPLPPAVPTSSMVGQASEPATAPTSVVAQPPTTGASKSPVPVNDTSATFSSNMFVPAPTRSVSPPHAALAPGVPSGPTASSLFGGDDTQGSIGSGHSASLFDTFGLPATAPGNDPFAPLGPSPLAATDVLAAVSTPSASYSTSSASSAPAPAMPASPVVASYSTSSSASYAAPPGVPTPPVAPPTTQAMQDLDDVFDTLALAAPPVPTGPSAHMPGSSSMNAMDFFDTLSAGSPAAAPPLAGPGTGATGFGAGTPPRTAFSPALPRSGVATPPVPAALFAGSPAPPAAALFGGGTAPLPATSAIPQSTSVASVASVGSAASGSWNPPPDQGTNPFL